jgi:hypothetical protein
VLKKIMESQNMKRRTFISITILTAILFLTFVTGTFAFHRGKNIRPYGDYCTSHYGMHREVLNNKNAENALKHYYSDKGLDIEIVNLKGRFVKALVKDNDKVIDIVIFDRRTGRIRSIY